MCGFQEGLTIASISAFLAAVKLSTAVASGNNAEIENAMSLWLDMKSTPSQIWNPIDMRPAIMQTLA